MQAVVGIVMTIIPKHRSGKDVFIETIGADGVVLDAFGPAVRE